MAYFFVISFVLLFVCGRLLWHSIYARFQAFRDLNAIPTQSFPDENDSRTNLLHRQRELLRLGYSNYSVNSQLFKVKQAGGDYKILLSREHLRQIRGLPGNIMSFNAAFERVILLHHTGAPRRGEWAARALRTRIPRHLNALVGSTISRAKLSLVRMIPRQPTMLKMNVFQTLRQCIAYVTVGIFCGDQLAEDREWLAATLRFTGDLFAAGAAIRAFNPMKRIWMGWRHPIARRIRADKKLAMQKLAPMFIARTADMNRGSKGASHDDGFQWLLDAAGPGVSLREFSDSMIRVLNAAIHTTAMTATNTLVEVLNRPQYLPELQAEAKGFLLHSEDSHGAADGLKKMDSFIRECMRCCAPQGLTAPPRLTQRRFTFQDGSSVPAGTLLTAPFDAICQDSSVYPNPETFDPWRFYNKRSQSKQEDTRQAFSFTSEEWLQFGLGVQACPGRWLASKEVKIILAILITQFDIEYDSAKSGGSPAPEYIEAVQKAPSRYWMNIRHKELT